MRKITRVFVQIVLAAALVVMFFIWAPWLVSQPIEQLKEVQIAHGEVPPEAKSYTVNHGKVYFRKLGTVSQQPFLFGLLTVAMVADLVLLVLSFPKGLRGRRKASEVGRQNK